MGYSGNLAIIYDTYEKAIFKFLNYHWQKQTFGIQFIL